MTEFAFSYLSKSLISYRAKIERVILDSDCKFDCVIIDAVSMKSTEIDEFVESLRFVNQSTNPESPSILESNAVVVILYADGINLIRHAYSAGKVNLFGSGTFTPITQIYLDCRSMTVLVSQHSKNLELKSEFSSELERVGVIYSNNPKEFKTANFGPAKKPLTLTSGGRVLAPKYATTERSVIDGKIIAELLYALYNQQWKNVLVYGAGRPFLHELIKYQPVVPRERFSFRVIQAETNLRVLSDVRMECAMAGIAVSYFESCPPQAQINEMVKNGEI